MTGCQWIEGEPSAEDGCKCGRPVEPTDRALDGGREPGREPGRELNAASGAASGAAAALTRRQGSWSIPYCDAHMARAYLPHALLWLKLREFSEAANGCGLAPDPLEPWRSMLARGARRKPMP